MNLQDLKILMVISKMGMGGAQRIVLDLANAMVDRGACVDILVFYRTAQDVSVLSGLDPRVKLMTLMPFHFKTDHERSMQKVLAFVLFPFMAIWWGMTNKLGKYQIVHVNLAMASLFVWLCSFFWSSNSVNKPKVIETFHSDLNSLSEWERKLFLFLWKRKDRLIVELRKDIEFLEHALGSGRVVYIPIGIHLLNQPTPEELGKARKMTGGLPVILDVSRLNQREKRILDLIKIIHRFAQIHQGDFIFMLVGDGPDKAEAQELTAALGLSRIVQFPGYMDDVSALYAICSAFLTVGVEDQVGVAGMQAASLGAPIVCFQSEPRWDREGGTFWNSKSYEAIAGELERLVVDSDYRRSASEYSEATVRKLFSVEGMVTSTLELYLSLLTDRS